MPAPTERLVLTNGRTGRIILPPGNDLLWLYVANPGDPQDENALRTQIVGELLTAALEYEGRRVRPVDNPDAAQMVVSTVKPPGTNFWLQVASVQGELEDVAVDADELAYLVLSMPHNVAVQLNEGTLAGARAALGRLREYYGRLKPEKALPLSKDGKKWRADFYGQLLDDLNTPRALAVVWTLLQSNLPNGEKLLLFAEFCRALGLAEAVGVKELPQPQAAPKPEAKPAPKGKEKPANNPKNAKKPAETDGRRRFLTSKEVWSHLKDIDRFDFTISLVAKDNLLAVRKTVESLLPHLTETNPKIEVIGVEMNGSDRAADFLDETAYSNANFRAFFTRDFLGEAAGRNVALKQSRGRYVLLAEAGTIFAPDFFRKLDATLENLPLALYGLFPVRLTRDGTTVTGFEAQEPTSDAPTDVEALDSRLLLVPRQKVDEVGLLDESFKLPYALGLDYSFNFRDKGLAVRALPGLSGLVTLPPERPTYGVPPEHQERQQQRNWKNFLQSWEL
jgi:hypothetical protein